MTESSNKLKLCVDAGGTKIRFAFIRDDMSIVEEIAKFQVSDFPGYGEGFPAALEAFLDRCSRYVDNKLELIDSLIVSAAGPVENGQVKFTNSNWTISDKLLLKQFGDRFATDLNVVLVNDFEALAYGIPCIEPDEFSPIYDREPGGDTSIVCGPGSGLGIASTKQIGEKVTDIIVIPSEGGHQTFATESRKGREIYDYFGDSGASYENILSGRGLEKLYSFYCHQNGTPNVKSLRPEEIIDRYHDRDVSAISALEAFATILGGFCGNMALTFRSTRGVYLWGGILKSFPEDLLSTTLVNRFQRRGQRLGILSHIPIRRIKSDKIALRGCAVRGEIEKVRTRPT